LRRTPVLWELYSAILKRNEKVLLAIRGSSVQECDATEASPSCNSTAQRKIKLNWNNIGI